MRLAFEAVLALLLFGCIPVVVKSIDANPYTIGIFRLAVATLAFGSFMAVRRRLHRVHARDLGRLAVIGALFFGHWITLFFAIKISSASIGAIGLSTYGVDLLLLGAIFAGQRIHMTDVVAVIVAAVGAILVVPSFTLSNATAAGMLLACLSALMYASLPLLHQRWSAIPTDTRTLGQFGFALAFFLLFAPRTDWTLTARDWAGLLFLAIGVTLVAHSFWVRVTTRLSPSATSIIYYGNIPFAILSSVLLLEEPLTVRTMSGALLIIVGSMTGLTAKARRT
ncbi:MAG TPA: DMT family transporter [Thermoanaerobaculia bacterium]|nr:DMT family transporter [Thermoanaerobaculia bacterium]